MKLSKPLETTAKGILLILEPQYYSPSLRIPQTAKYNMGLGGWQI